MEICGQVAWPVDAALRPEGGRGPLVRSLASHQAYYQRWARTWEFQALLKARPVAGDAGLGKAWLAGLQPLIWRAAERPEAVEDVRGMRRRIIDKIPPNEVDREIKRGPGGLRDIEFAVQLLQLVHGRADEKLRSGNTLTALRALVAGGYVGRQDGKALREAYRFLRRVEHALQLQRLRRTHTVPVDPRRCGGWPARSATALRAQRDLEAFRSVWVGPRRRGAPAAREAALPAPAGGGGQGARRRAAAAPRGAAQRRLELLGFADPRGRAAAHRGADRRGVPQRGHPAHAAARAAGRVRRRARPGRGLLAYRQVSDALGHPLVPEAAARRGAGGVAAGPCARTVAAT